VICALKPFSGSGPGVFENPGALPGWPGALGFVAFLQPAANITAEQAMARRPILNFIMKLFLSIFFKSFSTNYSCGFVDYFLCK
jgi:hypothetical protein